MWVWSLCAWRLASPTWACVTMAQDTGVQVRLYFSEEFQEQSNHKVWLRYHEFERHQNAFRTAWNRFECINDVGVEFTRITHTRANPQTGLNPHFLIFGTHTHPNPPKRVPGSPNSHGPPLRHTACHQCAHGSWARVVKWLCLPGLKLGYKRKGPSNQRSAIRSGCWHKP